MELEVRGWKGDQGSALLQFPANEAFFTEITRAADEQRRLLFVEISVGDRPVAMAANFTLGRTMFAFKIAYDPAFASCSPGILAEVETVRAFHAESDLEAADGGTDGASYLDKYWLRRQEMQDVYTSTGGYAAELHLRATAGLTRAKRAVNAVFMDRARALGARLSSL